MPWPWSKKKINLRDIIVNFADNTIDLVLKEDQTATIVAGKHHRNKLPKGCFYKRTEDESEKNKELRTIDVEEYLIFNPKVALTIDIEGKRCHLTTAVETFSKAIQND